MWPGATPTHEPDFGLVLSETVGALWGLISCLRRDAEKAQEAVASGGFGRPVRTETLGNILSEIEPEGATFP